MIVAPPAPDVLPRPRGRTALAAVLVAVLLTGLGALGLPSASAEPPSRLQQQVTDPVGALGGDTAEVEQRLDELRSTDQVQLWVSFVDSFDGMPAQQWAQETARMSDLGASDALLVVAVGDDGYWFEYDDQRTVQQIADEDIEPRLAVGDWSGAVIGAADGLESSGSGSGPSFWVVLAVIVGIAAVVAVVLVVSRKRREDRTVKQAASARDIPGDDTARMSQLSIDVLDARARDGLTDADQSVEASTAALATATGEFGEMRTRPFRDALDTARQEVDGAHSLIQRLDDDIPETPSQRRAMLLEVAARAERAE